MYVSLMGLCPLFIMKNAIGRPIDNIVATNIPKVLRHVLLPVNNAMKRSSNAL